MLRRYVTILFSAWALWGMSSLCVAGLLEHSCSTDKDHCAKGVDSGRSHDEPESPHDGGCGHESDCHSDPCSETMVRSKQSSDGHLLISLHPVALVRQVEEAGLLASSDRLLYDTPPRFGPLPIHSSDIPLLI